MEYDVFSNVSLVLDIITHLVDQVEMIDKLNPTKNHIYREKFGGIPLGLLTLRDTSSPGYVADATPLRDSVVMWRPNAGSPKDENERSQMGFWLCFYNLKDLFFGAKLQFFFCVLTFVVYRIGGDFGQAIFLR